MAEPTEEPSSPDQWSTLRRLSFQFSDNFSKLGYRACHKIAMRLSDEGTVTESWKDLADRLGYSTMDAISDLEVKAKAEKEVPAMLLLREWSKKVGSTIQVIVDALTDMERQDVLDIVEEAMKDQFRLHYVVVTAEGDRLPVSRVDVLGSDTLETSLQNPLEQTGLRTDDLVIQEPDMVEGDRLRWTSATRLVKGTQLVLRHKDCPPPPPEEQKSALPPLDLPSSGRSSLSSPVSLMSPITVSSPGSKGPFGSISPDFSTEWPSMVGSLEERTKDIDLSGNARSSLDNISVISEDVEWTEEAEEALTTSSLPGWHPHLPDREKYIKVAMAPYLQADGWFLVRPLDNRTLAVSVTFNNSIRHFKIHRTRDDQYYFHRKQRRAQSIGELISMYSIEGLPTSESRGLAAPPRTPQSPDEPPPLPPRPGQHTSPPVTPTRSSLVYLKHPIPVDRELEERLKKKQEEHHYKNKPPS